MGALKVRVVTGPGVSPGAGAGSSTRTSASARTSAGGRDGQCDWPGQHLVAVVREEIHVIGTHREIQIAKGYRAIGGVTATGARVIGIQPRRRSDRPGSLA